MMITIQIATKFKLDSYLNQQQLDIIDPMNIGLIYILRGTFKMTLRPKLRSDDDDQLVEIELNEGAEIDCEGI